MDGPPTFPIPLTVVKYMGRYGERKRGKEFFIPHQ